MSRVATEVERCRRAMLRNCPLLKWQDTVNGSPLEILESIPGMVRAAAHDCSRTVGNDTLVKVVSEKKFRGKDKGVNKPDDMVRVTLDMPIWKWKELKGR